MPPRIRRFLGPTRGLVQQCDRSSNRQRPMADRKRSKKTKGEPSATVQPRRGVPRPWSEFLGIALLAVGVLMLGGLVSYQRGTGPLMGPVGELIAASAYAGLGMGAYLAAFGVIGMGLQALVGRGMEISAGEGVGFTMATLAGCVLLHVMFPDYRTHGFTAGGLTGEIVGEVALGLFHHAGTYLVATAVLCLGLIASTPLSVDHMLAVGRGVVGGGVIVTGYVWHGVVELLRTQRDPGPAETEDGLFEFHSTHARDLVDEEFSVGRLVVDGATAVDETPALPVAEPPAVVATRKIRGNRRRRASPLPMLAAAGNTSRATEDDDDDDDEGVLSEQDQDLLDVIDDAEARESSSLPIATDDDADETDEDASDLPEIVVRAEPGELAAPVAPPPATDTPKKVERGIPGLVRLTQGPFELPPLHLFEAASQEPSEFDRQFVLEQAQRLMTVLAEFRIRGKVTKIHPGPVITRYEFKPEAGVKLSKIESLENDIAMALEAIRIRILAPIPGQASVGFEVPNRSRETVYIKEILAQDAFGQGKKLPLALGKDITGTATAIDLAKAPHLLVAGATGSGKSVGVNAMICSLLYTCTPDEVRMIMIDPKMLELSIYEGIPHLLLPVVTDPEKAALALRWAVTEMERRYSLLSDAQVRDIGGYNRKLPELRAQWEADRRLEERIAADASRDAAELGEDGVSGVELAGVTFDAKGNMSESMGGATLPDCPIQLPYVVVVIDEFADLMMVASKEVEQCVARIAAKARAAGIHLIVATQRPSVDVITGTIKNNFPSRIAFQVTSDIDSRTILDGKGAKQLLGMGDMLHMDRGMQPKRVHGCFVSEDEILKVVEFVKRQARPVYNLDIVRKDEDGTGDEADEALDSLYDRAVEIVAEAQKVSTSMLQRRLGVGYNRAAKIVEAMEERGVIGPARGTAPREVYVSAA